MTVKAIVHAEESGGYWAEVPALPGCFTEGDSIEELERNIREAVEGWLLAGEPIEASQDQVLEVAV
jgi:predicted RNase H-like HicB family nuclease